MQQTIIVDIHTMLTLIFPENHIVFAPSLHQPFSFSLLEVLFASQMFQKSYSHICLDLGLILKTHTSVGIMRVNAVNFTKFQTLHFIY